MEDPKACQFFEEVLAKTEQHRIHWEPTANESSFIAAVGGQFTLELSRYTAWGEDEAKVALVLKDRDRELLRVTDEVDGVEIGRLWWLYGSAKRRAPRVDENLDKVMAELTKL